MQGKPFSITILIIVMKKKGSGRNKTKKIMIVKSSTTKNISKSKEHDFKIPRVLLDLDINL